MDKENLQKEVYITVIIPVYRSGDSLRELYQRLVSVLTDQCLTFEILFVEDCGGDHSWDVIHAIVQEDSRVQGLRMSRNYGQHNAILAGIRAATGEFIITIDDDLQHPPEELPKLIKKINEGYDVVYGPPEQQQHGLFRDMASQITKIALQGAMGASTARQISALRIFRTELHEAFADYKGPSVNIDVLLTWATTKFGICSVKHEARKHGVSGYNTRKLFAHALNMMTGFSTIPLKVASLVGLCFALFGVSILIYVVLRYIVVGGGVPGFSFLASIIAIFSGAQLLALGILGEYIGRIHQRTMERPTYLVCETIQKSWLINE